MRIHVPIRLRWSDLDAYGHVNNAAMFGLLEEARIHAFWADGSSEAVGATGALDTRILEGGPNASTLTLIARQEIEYHAPIPYLREPLDIQLWIGHLGGASLDVCYEVWSPEGSADPVMYSHATTTIVLVDASSMKPRRMTEVERETMEPYVEAPVQFAKRH